MRLLLVHNQYQRSGGEDAVFEFEASLLERAGHKVHRLVVRNDINTIYEKMRTAWSLPWNSQSFDLVADAIAGISPDIMHVHNMFPLLSPSIYDAAATANVPVVQTLHNFRISCANGMLLRNGAPCELCISKSPYNAVRFRCYRDSYFGSFTVARLIASQRRENGPCTRVNRFVALSEFARSRFLLAGLPPDKITVKPNGAVDHGMRNKGNGSSILFVGRLSGEKGIGTLISAARDTGYLVRIVGDGPLRTELEMAAPPNVTFLGHISHDRVIDEMAQAQCLVLPSVSYEGCPVTLIEAYSIGLPVIASRLGSLKELVEDGVTGLHFVPNNATELANALEKLTRDDGFAARLGHQARKRYEERYTPERILNELEDIYHSVAA